MRPILSILAVLFISLAVLTGDSLADGFGRGFGFRAERFRERDFRDRDFRGFNRGVSISVGPRVGPFAFRGSDVRTFTDRNGNIFTIDRRGNRVFLGNVNGGYSSHGLGSVNTFGSRTFTDAFGNVFQVDAYGNAVLIGRSARGFGVQSYGFGFGY